MKIGKLVAIVLAIVVGGCHAKPVAQVDKCPPATVKTISVPIITSLGDVDRKSFSAFIEKHVDQVIGLKVEEDMNASTFNPDSDQQTVDGPEMEIGIVAKPSLEHGFYHLNGFFLVKAGNVYQGVMTYGLMPVDEAVVRLNPAVKTFDMKL